MDSPRKRETAYKLRVGDVLRGSQIFEETESLNKRLRYIEIGSKNIVRVNIIANIIDKFVSEGDRKFATITLDDGSGQIRARVFGEDIAKFSELSQGDTIIVIGMLRSFNQELYILPELVKKQDPKYLLIRKLETEKEFAQQTPQQKEEIKALKDDVLSMVKKAEPDEGINKDDIIMKITSSPPDLVSKEIQKLLEEGILYEPRPGRVRYLG